MTPATELGFEIGKLYRVIDDEKSADVGDGFSQKSEPLIRGVSFRSI